MSTNAFETAKVLLERLSDPSYRLPGEDPATADLAQARHWLETYDRLVGFKRDLLDRSRQFSAEASPEVGRVLQESDIILFEVQLSRFEQKRDFWKLRATELNGRRGEAA
ncbi:MAG TPA: hypothetical protein VFB69_02210 [Candidatus Dormibacteraeota bacterium]|nr:hypothetical protein [Candidatus Dormibacteraeota bacterium]